MLKTDLCGRGGYPEQIHNIDNTNNIFFNKDKKNRKNFYRQQERAPVARSIIGREYHFPRVLLNGQANYERPKL